MEKLGLSFKNSRELNKIIDEQLPDRPCFKHEEIVIGGEAFDVYFRDIIVCIRALYSDPELLPYLVFLPEKHYVDKERKVRLYHDMHTGKWWWSTQVSLLSYFTIFSCSDNDRLSLNATIQVQQ